MFFLVIMIVLLVSAVVAFLIFLSIRYGRLRFPGAKSKDAGSAAPAEHTYPAPPAVRLLGVVALLLAILLLNWVWLPRVEQFEMLLRFIYPGVFGIFLVLLFDKVARTWSNKAGAESFREWLFLDIFVFLLCISYVRLLHYQPAVAQDKELYGALFWDLLHIIGLFLMMWVIDRGTSRFRFLIAYLYLLWVPILALIWNTVQEVPPPENPSFWITIWPFFFLALIFLVLDVILLIAVPKDSESQAPFLFKDVIFTILYGILFIVAAP